MGKRKFILIMITLSIAIGLCGCGNGSDVSKNQAEEPESVEIIVGAIKEANENSGLNDYYDYEWDSSKRVLKCYYAMQTEGIDFHYLDSESKRLWKNITKSIDTANVSLNKMAEASEDDYDVETILISEDNVNKVLYKTINGEETYNIAK